MKERLSAGYSFFQLAFRAMAKAARVARKTGPAVILCFTGLALGVVYLAPNALMRARARLAGSETVGSFRWWPPQSVHAQGTGGTFTVFEAPGAGTGMLQGTMGTSINDGGDIAGVFLTAPSASVPNLAHGFVRIASTGSITEFDALGAGTGKNQGTFPASINTTGDIAGMYFDASNAYHGFVRSAAGTITQFDVPGAPTTTGHRGTTPLSINAGGDITGSYVDANDVRHGFVRSAAGSFTTFDVPGAAAAAKQGTNPLSINTAGDITGFYVDANGTFHGFVRAANGTITAPIDAPGAGTGTSAKLSFKGTLPDSINTGGDIAGVYGDANSVNHSFILSAGGTFTTFDAPGAGTTGFFPGTLAASINAGGDITGIYTDTNGVHHGFLRTAAATITAPIDAPGATTTGMLAGTILISINSVDDMTGTFMDASGVFHGFLFAAGSPPPPAATPTFSPAAGTYTSAQMVTISDTTPGATIYFTTDGTTPTTTSTKFTAPIPVNTTETIKAIATATGFSSSAVATATYTINLPTPNFQVSVNPATLTIVRGQSGTATFTVTPQNGFNSSVSFACSGLPSEAACSFNPPSVTPSGSAVTSALTVTTTAKSAALRVPMPSSRPPIYTVLFPVLAMIFGIAARRKGLRGLQLLALLLLLTVASGLTSCGGGGSPGNPGTPLGTSMVSVSASTSGGAVSHAATLTITITQ